MSGNNLQLNFPYLPPTAYADEKVKIQWESTKNKIISLIGEDGERMEDMPSLMSEFSKMNKDDWTDDILMIQDLINEPMNSKGEKIPKNSLGWLKRLFSIIKKIGNTQKTNATKKTSKRKQKEGDEQSEDESSSQKKPRINMARNIMQNDSPIPSNWWNWSNAPRYYKLKINGPKDEISMEKLIDKLSSLKLSYTFKIHIWTQFSCVLLSNELDRIDLANKLTEQGYSIEIPPWKLPQIKVLYLRHPINEGWPEYITKIMQLNGFHDKRQYEIVSTYELGRSSGKWGVTMNVSPAIRSQIETRLNGRISIGNTYLKVQDSISVLACRGGCNRIGHSRSKCRNQIRCIKCNKSHSQRTTCDTSELACGSCLKKGHTSFSYDCALYKAELAMVTSDYDFSYNYLMM